MKEAPLKEPTGIAPYLYRFYRSCKEMGARQPSLLAELDISQDDKRNPFKDIDTDLLQRLHDITVRETHVAEAALIIGQKNVPRSFSDFGYFAYFAETIGGAIAKAMHMQNGHDTPGELSLKTGGTNDYLMWQPYDQNADVRVLCEVFLSSFHSAGTALQGRHYPGIKSAHFAHSPMCDPILYEQYFKAPCHFDQPFSHIVFHDNYLDMANPKANASIATMMDSTLKKMPLVNGGSSSITSFVYYYLFVMLDKAELSSEKTAGFLGFADRTLRRKLDAEGTSFRTILEEVRRDICELYFVEGTLSLSEIAQRLGYSELSAFTRAYRSWHGEAPNHIYRHAA